VTGRGGHLIVIDDPLKGYEDANNKNARDILWNWYRSDLYTRQFPEAAIILVATRWNLDDLTGRLLEEQKAGGDKWTRIHLPALAEEKDQLGREVGEALWPDWFPKPALEAIRLTMPGREWASLYQQNPVADDGVYFNPDWFIDFDLGNFLQTHVYTRHEGSVRIYGMSDYAVSGDGGDFTVHLIVAVDSMDNLYVLDMWRGQTTSDVWIESAIDLMEKWKVGEWLEESGQIEKGIGPFLSKRMHERKVYCLRTAKFSARDKEQRARPIQARSAMGKLFVPQRAPWYSDFLVEVGKFPVYKTDDIVDALSLLGRVLDELSSGRPAREPEPTGLRKTTAHEYHKYNRMLRKYGGRRQAIVV
jgi:predicted phage terminase large subunit-like protein